MGYPYAPATCKGPLCPVHGDARDTSLAEPLLTHYDASGASCACQDGLHDAAYTCQAQKQIPFPAYGRTVGDIFPPCCGG